MVKVLVDLVTRIAVSEVAVLALLLIGHLVVLAVGLVITEDMVAAGVASSVDVMVTLEAVITWIIGESLHLVAILLVAMVLMVEGSVADMVGAD